jgi:hypothetical protein
VTRWRYIAQDLPSGEFREWHLPLTNVEITRTLSGPGRLTGQLPVPLAELDGVLRPWGTAIWAEADEQIRGGGILTPWQAGEQALTVDCVGISGYPQGMPWTGPTQALIDVDPLDVVRMIWSHLQSQPGGDLGVVVDATTSPVRVGEPERDVSFTTGEGQDVEFTAGPFRLEWWSTHDLGRVQDDLAADTPFDYLEDTAWDGDELVHRLRLGYPTLGARRTDLRFALGENVSVVPTLDAEDDDYASDVLALGAGEGQAMVHTSLHRPDAAGLRRVHVYTDKTARSTSALAGSARRELAWLTGAPRVRTLSVTDHPHAGLGSFDVGDEIFVEGASGWVTLDRWVRIVERTINPDAGDRITLTVVEV